MGVFAQVACPASGDYDGSGAIETADFDAWRSDFVSGKAPLFCFEYWRRATFEFGALPTPTSPPSDSRRGRGGDLWADIIIGKRDFTEIAPNTVVANKVFNPGGVVVDTTVKPGRMYVWDSGNSRVVGVDLSRCYQKGSKNCAADLVLGQPQLDDWGSCNRDASFQTYPERPASSAETLCGIPEGTLSILENKSFVEMAVDSVGNLYVPDFYNHRVLKYNKPFETDTVADEVWGQDDFTGNLCNKTALGKGGSNYDVPDESAASSSSLCFASNASQGAGAAFDSDGNLWVADGGNNRVLRFSKDESGAIAKNADLVLGQTTFNSNTSSEGNGLDQMNGPDSVAFDSAGRLYVAEGENRRVLVFDPPFSTGMSASRQFGDDGSYISMDPGGRGLWQHRPDEIVLYDTESGEVLLRFAKGTPGNGGLGFDSDGNLFAAFFVYTQNVIRFKAPDYEEYVAIFSPMEQLRNNQTTDKRLYEVHGLAVTNSQLVASDNRLLFWNNPQQLVSGQKADGELGEGFAQLKVDDMDRVWTRTEREIVVYQAPLTRESRPVKILTYPFVSLEGDTISSDKPDFCGVAPTGDADFVWVSDSHGNRVFRIRDPLSNNGRPQVDVVLGQLDSSGTTCNRGGNVAGNTLCRPCKLSVDKKNNLYVSDHSLEAEGNFRLLMFAADSFPNDPSDTIFAPNATKSFPKNGPQPHATWEPAFDSKNRMVVGYNPYVGGRFVGYYNDPLSASTVPDGYLKDFYSLPVAIAFDRFDNLYVGDSNRGKILIYKQPFKDK